MIRTAVNEELIKFDYLDTDFYKSKSVINKFLVLFRKDSKWYPSVSK
jgi:hypothetical protein